MIAEISVILLARELIWSVMLPGLSKSLMRVDWITSSMLWAQWWKEIVTEFST